MFAVLAHSAGYAIFIALGYALVSIGVLPRASGRVLSALMVCVTLPASIIVGLNGHAVAVEDLRFLVLGVLCNVVALGASWAFARRWEGDRGALAMVSVSGCNVGGFALPLASGLLPGRALVQMAVFDIGNSIMCLGLNKGFASMVLGGRGGAKVRDLLGSLVGSAPVMTYLLMLGLCLVGRQVPSPLAEIVGVAGEANPLVAMMVIGTSMVGERRGGSKVGEVARLVLLRMAVSVVQVVGVLVVPFVSARILGGFAPSFSPDDRLVASVLLLAPVAAMGTVFARQLGLDEEVAAKVNSVYTPISLVAMSLAIGLSGVAR